MDIAQIAVIAIPSAGIGALGMAFLHTCFSLNREEIPNLGEEQLRYDNARLRADVEHYKRLYGIEAGQVDDLIHGAGFQ
jgi:hypothetical protein